MGLSTVLPWVFLKEDGHLEFQDRFKEKNLCARKISDLFDVLANRQQEPAEGVAYFMYRGVYHENDVSVFERTGIRHDLTVIRPGTVNGEFLKTYGHYHPESRPGGPTYPEVYEVLYGRGYFLMQKASDSMDRLEDVYLVEGKVGSKVVIPPGYGHVTVNPGTDWLLIANLVYSGFQAVYEPYRVHHGAA